MIGSVKSPTALSDDSNVPPCAYQRVKGENARRGKQRVHLPYVLPRDRSRSKHVFKWAAPAKAEMVRIYRHFCEQGASAPAGIYTV
jgi:hypothetical protein